MGPHVELGTPARSVSPDEVPDSCGCARGVMSARGVESRMSQIAPAVTAAPTSAVMMPPRQLAALSPQPTAVSTTPVVRVTPPTDVNVMPVASSPRDFG